MALHFLPFYYEMVPGAQASLPAFFTCDQDGRAPGHILIIGIVKDKMKERGIRLDTVCQQ